MREIEGREIRQLPVSRHLAHNRTMHDLGLDGIICIARHPKTAHTFSYEVCVMFCDVCDDFTRLVKDLGYLPVKVQRISRGAEAATPAAAHELPGGTSS